MRTRRQNYYHHRHGDNNKNNDLRTGNINQGRRSLFQTCNIYFVTGVSILLAIQYLNLKEVTTTLFSAQSSADNAAGTTIADLLQSDSDWEQATQQIMNQEHYTKSMVRKPNKRKNKMFEAVIKNKESSLVSYLKSAAICVLMKGEESYVEEWIDYNIGIGFKHVYIYDNSPTFELEAWSKHHQHVTSVHWPEARSQHRAQKDCLINYGVNHTWVALLDGDEFLVLKKHTNVSSLLLEHCKKGALSLNWVIFGTGNQTSYENLPVTKRFLYREARASSTIKTILRVQSFNTSAKITNPHAFPLNQYDGVFQHDTNGNRNFSASGASNRNAPVLDVAVVHHYRYKSLAEWRIKGCVRKMAAQSDKQCFWPAVTGSVYDDSAWSLLKLKVPKYQNYDHLPAKLRHISAGICTVLEDELYLDEWVEYHLGIGFDQIYIYDTSANYTVYDWGYYRDKIHVVKWNSTTHQALHHCLNTFKNETYLTLSSIHEFFVFKNTKHTSIQHFLQEYSQASAIIVSMYDFAKHSLQQNVPITKDSIHRLPQISTSAKAFIKDRHQECLLQKLDSILYAEQQPSKHDYYYYKKQDCSSKKKFHIELCPLSNGVFHFYHHHDLDLEEANKYSYYDDSAWIILKKYYPKYKVLYDYS